MIHVKEGYSTSSVLSAFVLGVCGGGAAAAMAASAHCENALWWNPVAVLKFAHSAEKNVFLQILSPESVEKLQGVSGTILATGAGVGAGMLGLGARNVKSRAVAEMLDFGSQALAQRAGFAHQKGSVRDGPHSAGRSRSNGDGGDGPTVVEVQEDDSVTREERKKRAGFVYTRKGSSDSAPAFARDQGQRYIQGNNNRTIIMDRGTRMYEKGAPPSPMRISLRQISGQNYSSTPTRRAARHMYYKGSPDSPYLSIFPVDSGAPGVPAHYRVVGEDEQIRKRLVF